MLHSVGRDTEGKVVVGELFELFDTKGLPLVEG